MRQYIEYLILGIVQGFTEFLPVSSSGHLSLFQHLFGYSGESNLILTVLLHIGTLVAVFIVYHKIIWELIKELFRMIGDIFTGKFTFKLSKMSFNRRMLLMLILTTAMLAVLVIPVKGYKLTDLAATVADGSHMLIVGLCFMFTAALLLTAYFLSNGGKHAKRHDNATVGDALYIGGAQIIAAVFAGVSRSGSTIATGLICGLKREYMVQYSFLLSIPAIIAAALSEGKDALSSGVDINWTAALIGMAAAVVCGVLAIKAIEWIVKKDHYNYFGYYCAVLGVLVVIMSIVEKTTGVSNIVELFK